MTFVKKFVAAIMLISVGTFMAAVISPQTARGANTQSVMVVNTPLPVQGTVDAHITNATVPVSGTVAVSSLPAVTLSGTPAVSFTNTSSTPLFVDTDGPARSAIGASCDITFPNSPTQLSCLLTTVPAGKTLVIETVTCRAGMPSGGGAGPFLLSVGAPPDAASIYYDLALARANNIPGFDTYALTSPIRAYAVSGTGVYLIGVGESSPSVIGGVVCSIAGHLVAQ